MTYILRHCIDLQAHIPLNILLPKYCGCYKLDGLRRVA